MKSGYVPSLISEVNVCPVVAARSSVPSIFNELTVTAFDVIVTLCPVFIFTLSLEDGTMPEGFVNKVPEGSRVQIL